MTAKSIVDVQVNDESFKDFVTLFNEYRAQLNELPAAWNKVGKAVDATAEGAEAIPGAAAETAAISEDIVASFAEMTAALMAQAEQHRKIAATEQAADAKRRKEREEQQKADKQREKSEAKYQASVAKVDRTIKETRQNVAGIAGGIASAAVDVLKWVGLGGIAGGLIGTGGLFGLDRLAGNAGESRRTAQGLDTSVGDLKAFSVNYQRAVDAGSYLSNIETVARTPGLQYGVGSDIARMQAEGKNTADIGAALIPLIKQTFQQYGGNAYGLKASGLDNIVSLQDAIRISKLSDAEIAEIGAKFEKGKAQLAVNDQVAKDWQDLSVQLNNAGERIENVLIKDLDKLAPVINHLSDEAVDLVDRFVNKAVPAIDQFASYLDSDDFKRDLKSGADAVKEFADGALEAARTLGLISRPGADPGATTVEGDTLRALGYGPRPDPKIDSNHTITMWNATHPNEPQVPLNPDHPFSDATTPQQYKQGFDPNHPNAKDPFNWWNPGSWQSGDHSPGTAPWEDHHNPGNLRVPGKSEFQSFGSDADGIRAIDRQLKLYQHRDHLDTIEGVVNKYAPRADHNDTDAYIKNLVARTGFAKDQHLNFDDTSTASSVISGITKQENSKSNFAPQAVKIMIENQTGGSAVVSTSQFPS